MERDSSSVADITQHNELSFVGCIQCQCFNINDSQPGDVLEDGSRQSGTD